MHHDVEFSWGYALGWPKKLLERDPDPFVAKLLFLAEHGLRTTDMSLSECEQLQGARLGRISDLLKQHDLGLTVRPMLPFFTADLPSLYTQVDRAVESLGRLREQLRIQLVTVGVVGMHRFLREPSLTDQMSHLSSVLSPLAEGCCRLGLRLGIENHGDFYASDLVELCQRTPHLGIFFDTGNCFLIGEKPLAAAHAAAPFVVGSHFKDQRVRPMPKNSPLCFEVGNAIPGDGDVPLREIYQTLCEWALRGAPLIMEIECFPADSKEPLPEIARAITFVRSLTDPQLSTLQTRS